MAETGEDRRSSAYSQGGAGRWRNIRYSERPFGRRGGGEAPVRLPALTAALYRAPSILCLLFFLAFLSFITSPSFFTRFCRARLRWSGRRGRGAALGRSFSGSRAGQMSRQLGRGRLPVAVARSLKESVLGYGELESLPRPRRAFARGLVGDRNERLSPEYSGNGSAWGEVVTGGRVKRFPRERRQSFMGLTSGVGACIRGAAPRTGQSPL